MEKSEKESRSDGECDSAEEEEVDPRVQVLSSLAQCAHCARLINPNTSVFSVIINLIRLHSVSYPVSAWSEFGLRNVDIMSQDFISSYTQIKGVE